MNEKILVVDDEKEIADLLEVYLKNDNYTVYKYYSGIEALKCIEETEIDLAILDIMLPDIDGFRICQKIREKFYFPVIMLTAKIEDGDKIMGLTIGADDYITNDIYKKVVPVDVVLTTTAYNKIYNLPMSSGSWFSYSETEKSLCMVVNKEAESYFNTPYAVGNTDSSLSLTPFNVTGTVNDGKDIPTVYLDAQAVEEFLPNMWQVQNASVYWHLTKGLTTNQMYSSLDDILQDTIGGHIEYSGRSDIGDAYDSVLSMLQLGLLITSFLLLFVSVLGQINIGLSSLEQRTYELLIRRAIGASRINIVALVLGTQLVISIFVCIVSILLSILIVEGIGIFLPPDTPVASPAYPFFSAVVAVVASVTVALLGGLLPALKAAKLEPALALR